jgi:hypothetical protein
MTFRDSALTGEAARRVSRAWTGCHSRVSATKNFHDTHFSPQVPIVARKSANRDSLLVPGQLDYPFNLPERNVNLAYNMREGERPTLLTQRP